MTVERASTGSLQPQFLIVGRVGRAHGTRGAVHVHPLTDRPDWVFKPGFEVYPVRGEKALPAEGAGPLVISQRRGSGKKLVVSFEGLVGRDAASLLTNRFLLAPVENLAPREDGEYFHHELVGVRVVTLAGENLGRVSDLFAVAQTKLIEVERSSKRSFLVPFRAEFVAEVDLEGGRLVLDAPPGLLEP